MIEWFESWAGSYVAGALQPRPAGQAARLNLRSVLPEWACLWGAPIWLTGSLEIAEHGTQVLRGEARLQRYRPPLGLTDDTSGWCCRYQLHGAGGLFVDAWRPLTLRGIPQGATRMHARMDVQPGGIDAARRGALLLRFDARGDFGNLIRSVRHRM